MIIMSWHRNRTIRVSKEKYSCKTKSSNLINILQHLLKTQPSFTDTVSEISDSHKGVATLLLPKFHFPGSPFFSTVSSSLTSLHSSIYVVSYPLLSPFGQDLAIRSDQDLDEGAEEVDNLLCWLLKPQLILYFKKPKKILRDFLKKNGFFFL